MPTVVRREAHGRRMLRKSPARSKHNHTCRTRRFLILVDLPHRGNLLAPVIRPTRGMGSSLSGRVDWQDAYPALTGK